ncbi:MAG: cell division protein ZapA [Henriciella sp.]|nr:cell division protein ZapA [Hyphomonadaceae bacterium]
MAKADIKIRDRNYSVACAPGQEERLVALSRQLDARVQDISRAVGNIGDDRLLLIASLALLDELDASHRAQAAAAGPDIERAAQALNDTATRIEALAARIEAEK